MSEDEQRLMAVVRYAGSDVGDGMRRDLLGELARLRRIEAAAADAVNIALNDAGPEAFATMATLRECLRTTHPTHTEDK